MYSNTLFKWVQIIQIQLIFNLIMEPVNHQVDVIHIQSVIQEPTQSAQHKPYNRVCNVLPFKSDEAKKRVWSTGWGSSWWAISHPVCLQEFQLFGGVFGQELDYLWVDRSGEIRHLSAIIKWGEILGWNN